MGVTVATLPCGCHVKWRMTGEGKPLWWYTWGHGVKRRGHVSINYAPNKVARERVSAGYCMAAQGVGR